ncbi:MAG: 3-oxoacyl-ACP reductase FabG, partial [Candidatus Hydrogenedentales bacterium]
FAKEGAVVAVCGRSPETSEAAARELAQESSGNVTGYGCNIADAASVDAMFKAIGESIGAVSILVNNAGITRDGLLLRMKPEDWSAVVDTNLTGAFNCTRAALRGMIKQRYGRIINISSVIGLHGQAGQANYSAAKAGLIGFTKATAQEVASRNITANVIAPGYIATDMTAGLAEDLLRVLLERIPLGRSGTVDEIAGTVKFLASDTASYITGAVLQVDGGLGM